MSAVRPLLGLARNILTFPWLDCALVPTLLWACQPILSQLRSNIPQLR